MMTEIEIKKLVRENRELKASLKKLSNHVLVFLFLLDESMVPGVHTQTERGQRIARLANALDMTNDQVRLGSLKVGITKEDKAKTVAKLIEASKPQSR